MGVRGRITVVIVAVLAAAGALTAAPATAAVHAGSGWQHPSPQQEDANVRAGIGNALHPAAASDADPSKFIDGDLVSDAVFFDGTAWNESAIQSFLNSKVSSCAAASPNPTCLNTYTQTTTAQPADAECSGYTPAGSPESSAHIIATVSTSCGINPVVLLALLQKEQGLVTSTAPTQYMYDHATGWLCPDTPSGCSTSSGTTGFFNQVYGAAWQFKRYGVGGDFDWYPVGQVSAIAYNTDASCGTKQVAVWNKATAALYYYTPYTPNAASLASYPLAGDACSAYGIRNFWMLLNAWYATSSATGSVPAVTRLSGSDRFATSVAVSQAAYPSPGTAGVPVVFIASALNFPDALAAAPAAAKLGGPLLLVRPDAVPFEVQQELTRLNPQSIVIAGGQNAVSDAVATQLSAFSPSVRRDAGGDRFATGRAIAKDAFGTSATTAYIASGLAFPDALSAGGPAGAQGMPVLLVNGGLTAPDSDTVTALHAMGITTVKVIGGTASISDGFASGLGGQGFTVTRIAGGDRFDTSVLVNQDAFGSATALTLVASGIDFPDALSGAAYAGHAHAPLVVTRPGCVDPRTAVMTLRSSTFGLVGGPNALADTVGMLSVCQ